MCGMFFMPVTASEDATAKATALALSIAERGKDFTITTITGRAKGDKLLSYGIRKEEHRDAIDKIGEEAKYATKKVKSDRFSSVVIGHAKLATDPREFNLHPAVEGDNSYMLWHNGLMHDLKELKNASPWDTRNLAQWRIEKRQLSDLLGKGAFACIEAWKSDDDKIEFYAFRNGMAPLFYGDAGILSSVKSDLTPNDFMPGRVCKFSFGEGWKEVEGFEFDDIYGLYS